MLFEFNRGTSPIHFISIKYSPISHYACYRSCKNYHIDKIMKANLIINPINPLLFIIRLVSLLLDDPHKAASSNLIDLSLGRSISSSILYPYSQIELKKDSLMTGN